MSSSPPVIKAPHPPTPVSVKSSLACLEVWKAYAPAMLYSGDEDKLVAVKKLNPSARE